MVAVLALPRRAQVGRHLVPVREPSQARRLLPRLLRRLRRRHLRVRRAALVLAGQAAVRLLALHHAIARAS